MIAPHHRHYFLDLSEVVHVGYREVVVQEVVIRLEGQTNWCLSIMEGEGDVEVGVRMYAMGGSFDDRLIDERDVGYGIPLCRVCWSRARVSISSLGLEVTICVHDTYLSRIV